MPPVIAYLAADVPHQKLGATMSALAAASGLGQTLGSILSGWLFGAIAQRTFGVLMLPLGVMLVVLVLRPAWLSGQRDRLR